jgi:hypothetical protein
MEGGKKLCLKKRATIVTRKKLDKVDHFAIEKIGREKMSEFEFSKRVGL